MGRQHANNNRPSVERSNIHKNKTIDRWQNWKTNKCGPRVECTQTKPDVRRMLQCYKDKQKWTIDRWLNCRTTYQQHQTTNKITINPSAMRIMQTKHRFPVECCNVKRNTFNRPLVELEKKTNWSTGGIIHKQIINTTQSLCTFVKKSSSSRAQSD